MKRLFCLMVAAALLLTIPVMSFAAPSPEIPKNPPDIDIIIEDLQTIYRLTIYYIYLDGTPAAPTFTEQLQAGTPYNVPSPHIPRYTPTIDVVNGTMPPRDVEYTVIYIPVNNPDDPDETSRPILTIEDYETPLGLGETIMNVGICVE